MNFLKKKAKSTNNQKHQLLGDWINKIWYTPTMEVTVITVTLILQIGASKSGTKASHTRDHLTNMTKGIKMMVGETITKNGAENKLVDLKIQNRLPLTK